MKVKRKRKKNIMSGKTEMKGEEPSGEVENERKVMLWDQVGN